MAEFHPYSSAEPFFQDGAEPGILVEDQRRLRAYGVYEQMYYNHPGTFALLQRGEDEAPIYLPSAKTIVESTNRFLAINFDFVIRSDTGTTNDQDMLDTTIRDTLKRERFWLKFNSQRRFGLVRGDAVWHITANDAKPELTRISIHAIPANRYFPIFFNDDPENVIGCHLIDMVPDPRDDTKRVVRRQTYRKTVDEATGVPTGEITSETGLYTIGKWDDRHLKPSEIELVQILKPPEPLPPLITALPVYHIPNDWAAGQHHGSSLLRGVETMLSAGNQGISDQALALAIAGLGSYWTNASPPIDLTTGEPTGWEIGPLRMTEVPMDREVGRLEGITSVTPSIEHIDYVINAALRGASVPDIAAGKVDVAIAESGISLRLQLAPILAANAEREQSMLAVYDQMFFDLTRMWLPAYERITTDAKIETIVDDPLPKNREAQIKEIIDLVTAKVLSVREARAELVKIGYEIDEGTEELLAEQQATAQATDTFGQRAAEELNAQQGVEEEVPGGAPVQA